jgi:hypothetical protein
VSARDVAHRMALDSARRVLGDDMQMMLKSAGGSAAVNDYVMLVEEALLQPVRMALAARKRIKRNAKLIKRLAVVSAPSHTANGAAKWQ